jgi:superoxide reductase
MDRRNFIRLGIYAGAGSLVVPRSVIAAGAAPSMAGGVYYTGDAPGRWNKKVASHLPNIEIEKTADGASIQVETRHTIEGYNHYIIKHVVLDGNYAFVDEHMFDPLKDKHPLSTFSLPAYSGPVYVLSVCNIHDTWLNMAEI